MKAGLIDNWSDVEDIWEYMLYNELGIEEGNHPILITEVANVPRKNREKIAEVRWRASDFVHNTIFVHKKLLLIYTFKILS